MWIVVNAYVVCFYKGIFGTVDNHSFDIQQLLSAIMISDCRLQCDGLLAVLLLFVIGVIFPVVNSHSNEARNDALLLQRIVQCKLLCMEQVS